MHPESTLRKLLRGGVERIWAFPSAELESDQRRTYLLGSSFSKKQFSYKTTTKEWKKKKEKKGEKKEKRKKGVL